MTVKNHYTLPPVGQNVGDVVHDKHRDSKAHVDMGKCPRDDVIDCGNNSTGVKVRPDPMAHLQEAIIEKARKINITCRL